MKDHVHQWQPVSKTAEIIVDNKCVFVCECGACKNQKITII